MTNGMTTYSIDPNKGDDIYLDINKDMPREAFSHPYYKCRTCTEFYQKTKEWRSSSFCKPLCFFTYHVDLPFNIISECWKWNYTQNHFGHGMMPGKFRAFTTIHSWSYQYFIEPVPKGLVVRHLCRTRNCSNPNHLAMGTYKQNTQDAIDQGTFKAFKKSAGTRLPPEKVLEVFQATERYKVIAERYNISKATVSAIKLGLTWSDITGLPKKVYKGRREI